MALRLILKKKTSLSNSMDNILVNYGVSFTNKERVAIRYRHDDEESEALKSKIKTCSWIKFIV